MMSMLTTLFSGGVSKVVDSVGSAIDRLVTSDEERGKLKNALEKEMNSFKKEQLAAVAEYDREVTTRHSNDMKSDSWMSKNIRPLILLFLTVSTVLLAYLTIFILPADKVELVEPWISLLQVLLVTAYSFYFGGRSFEKVQNIKTKAE